MKKVINFVREWHPHALAAVIAFVFLSSLPFKFSLAPETMTIFGRLDAWAGSFGMLGLFSPSGLFGPYVIGAAEGVASILLLVGISAQFRKFQAYGALLAALLMTGAVFFHLCTPLGIDPNNDGGGLFVMAVVSWLSGIYLVWKYRKTLHH